MMNNLLVLLLTAIVFNLISCNKDTPTKELSVFENLAPCKCDSINGDPEDCKIIYRDRFELKDVEGKLYSQSNYSLYVRLNETDAAKVPRDRFPIWEKRGGIIAACNMPKEISQKDFDGVRVKLSCNLLYEQPPLPGRSLIASGGYSVDLLRIELLK
jgi:hypothetical protein